MDPLTPHPGTPEPPAQSAGEVLLGSVTVPELTAADTHITVPATLVGDPQTNCPPADPIPPPRKRIRSLGDYLLGDKIGTGGMASVYRAIQISKKRPAAVKVLRPEVARNELFLKRFRREAEVMARLRHPGIVRCYGLGKSHGRWYLAMELVKGASLGDWLYRLGRLSVGDAVHVALAVARALQYAHRNGLIHRDVKPDNIMITRDGRVKLADLGLATALVGGHAEEATGRGAGTPVYMAPEQARDASSADPRSDLYAVGCVLYHMLTGGLPFNGESAREVIFAKLEGEYPMALVRNPQVPGPLEAVLARLLKPHPDERYQSASDLIEALEVLRLSSDTPTFVRLDEGDPSTIPTAPRKEKRWYAEFRASDGTWQRQRMTSAQVRAALDDEAFVRTARVGRHPDALRPVEEHSEFQLPLSERPSDEERGPAAGRGTFLIGLALAAATAALGLCLYRVLA